MLQQKDGSSLRAGGAAAHRRCQSCVPTAALGPDSPDAWPGGTPNRSWTQACIAARGDKMEHVGICVVRRAAASHPGKSCQAPTRGDLYCAYPGAVSKNGCQGPRGTCSVPTFDTREKNWRTASLKRTFISTPTSLRKSGARQALNACLSRRLLLGSCASQGRATVAETARICSQLNPPDCLRPSCEAFRR